MSERYLLDPQGPIANGAAPVSPPDETLRHGFWWKFWLVLKTIQARLRFVVILTAIGGLIAYWDTINAYWEKWTRPAAAVEAAGDTEYFCPMHPYIVRDNPKEKCPICHMDLARRKKGTDNPEPLPPGTVSRVQLTPYRVVLAGVQTSEVQYRSLAKELTTFGTVEFNETTQAHIAARQKGRIVKLHVNYTGQMVDKGEELAILDVRYSPELSVTLEDLLRAQQRGDQAAAQMARKRLRIWDINDKQIEEFLSTGKVNTQLTIHSPIKGHVIKKYQREGNFVEEGTPLYDLADLETVWIQAQVYEADQAPLQEGLKAKATTLSLPNEVFEGTLDFVYPHLDESSRTLTVRFDVPNRGHKLRPGMYATVKIRVRPDQIDLFSRVLAEDWARHGAADLLAQALATPAGPMLGAGLEPLLRSAGRYAVLRRGLALAVPDSAVIDTGSLKIVYREASTNVYEGVLVELGPRMVEPGNPIVLYPVLRGLEAGDRVVTNGAFLVDAETRLNPAAGSIYFGGSGGKAGQSVAVRPSTPVDLGDEDRRLIEVQKFCPITNKPLGSMGTPVKVAINDQPVFLCCDGCEDKAKDNPARTLEAVTKLKARAKTEARRRD